MNIFAEKQQHRKDKQREANHKRSLDPAWREDNKGRLLEGYHARGVGNTGALRRAADKRDPLQAIDCPCCRQRVTVPTLEIVIDRYRVTPLEARILRAIWKGKGMPVMTERIFDSMYSDDPDGGPSPTRMYSAFKVALCHLRARLAGSGIGIDNCGYRQGYRLVLGEH
jgi:hypothetical protein